MKLTGKLEDIFHDYLLIILGSAITAAAINIFLVPYRLAPGGVTGIATVIYYIAGRKLPVGTIMLLLNIPLFLSGYKYIGRRFVVRTVISTILLSVIIDLTKSFALSFSERLETENVPAGPDYLLYAVFGGFFMGLGLGLVFKSGATTGGTDMTARIVHHFNPHVSMGKTLLFVDTVVILFAMVALESFSLAMYSVVALYVSSKTVDIILEGVNFAKAVFIISDFPDEIASDIMKELNRGVTAFKGIGMYTGSDKKVLYCVLHRGQLAFLKSLAKKRDPKALVVLSDVTEVLGEGFKTHE